MEAETTIELQRQGEPYGRGWSNFNYEKCARHGWFIRSATRGGTFQFFPCPGCEKEKREKEKSEKAKARIEERIQAAMIPPRFLSKTIDGFVASNPGQARAKAVCEAYVKDIDSRFKEGQSLVFSGRPGTGKTHLAASIANAAMAKGYSALFRTAAGLVRMIRDSWSDGTESTAMADIAATDLLIIDECGAIAGTENEKKILFEIINARYERMKPTIVLSNLGAKELEESLGPRTFDRLRENGGKFVVFDWESYRRQA